MTWLVAHWNANPVRILGIVSAGLALAIGFGAPDHERADGASPRVRRRDLRRSRAFTSHSHERNRIMNWAELAKLFLGPALMVIAAKTNKPEIAGLVPIITNGIDAAQAIPGSTGADRKAHVQQLVVDAAAGISATPVKIDPAIALAITNGVFAHVDQIHQIIKDNQPTDPNA